MNVLQGRNVNRLWVRALALLARQGTQTLTRGGAAYVLDTPVCSVFERPMERVLFDPVRRANPYFHLMEALWMLTGRNDAEFLDHYVHDFGARFAESDGHVHGAYGYRWRHHFSMDQLEEIIELLGRNVYDRQVVLQMWDVDSDLGFSQKKDRPCNTHAYLRFVNEALDLTVMTRSNDIVWGAYGANAVHFSVLLEYLAGRIGVRVGRLYQFANNWHGYCEVVDNIRKAEWEPNKVQACSSLYESDIVRPRPMADDWTKFDTDLRRFMFHHNDVWGGTEILPYTYNYNNPWFAEVAVPMMLSWWHYKRKEYAYARLEATHIEATDWREACLSWLEGTKLAAKQMEDVRER